MTNAFRSKILQSLDDANLQAALDGNAARRKQSRTTAYASLPEELQAMRKRAHAVRAMTTARLDSYLEQFMTRVEENGTAVHLARDAEQAREFAVNIALQHQARLVVKSKTMVGEEVEINSALEEQGIQVIETDLGEYIVQLRGEPPAHIITPAVHLRRADVAQTFHERLDIPYDDRVASMTETARRILRRAFLDADIGISGVNFGVVDTGSLCILTNEGNGRLVTTLPPVHIALMGIERLVPSLDDLALMLHLLPRSATGQKLTVYTSLMHGPRHPDEVDGPAERHLILVDNGRSALRESSLAEILYCIRCGACINVCPVFREIGGHAYLTRDGATTPYPGPIGSVLSPGLFGQAEFGHLARASSLCGACREACPVDIDLPKLLLRVRAGNTPTLPAHPLVDQGGPLNNAPRSLRYGLRLFTWLAASPRRFAAAQSLAGAVSRVAAPFSDWIRLPSLTGWGYSRDFPRPAKKPFRARVRESGVPGSSSTNIVQDLSGHAHLERANIAPTPAISPGSEPLIKRFETELIALGGRFCRCAEDQIAGQVFELLQERDLTRIQSWDRDHLPAGLLEALQRKNIQVQISPDEGIKAGLTGALAGAAESGTLVVTAGKGKPLTASLLQELHIVILHASDIHESLSQVLELEAFRKATSSALISGPSRTADIEMTLTIGVHGPAEVCVLCVT